MATKASAKAVKKAAGKKAPSGAKKTTRKPIGNKIPRPQITPPVRSLLSLMLDAVEESIIAMYGDEWQDYLDTLPPKEVDTLETYKSNLESFRKVIIAAQLEALAQAMAKHAAALRRATDDVNQALTDLGQIKEFVATVGKFVTVLAKVVALLA